MHLINVHSHGFRDAVPCGRASARARRRNCNVQISHLHPVFGQAFPSMAMSTNRLENLQNPPSGPRILIIEDEAPMRTVLKDILQTEGYRVLTAADGEAGLAAALTEKPELILLDIMLPKLDGFALGAQLRSLEVTIPILMLTAKDRIEDRVTGLDSGADDYLVKPFSTDELLARVRALLRRTRRQARLATALDLGDIHIDLVRQTARRGRKPMYLTAREFAILRLLAEAGGEPVTRDRFLDVVWGYTAFPTTRTVDNHIAALRAKIEVDPKDPRWIRTVHGVGYRLEV
ncbi:MAG: DNA-binding response regulator [Acidobacteria bacterium]|nr:DNA-binding response regulator [Acidobacteriota bacterium]